MAFAYETKTLINEKLHLKWKANVRRNQIKKTKVTAKSSCTSVDNFSQLLTW